MKRFWMTELEDGSIHAMGNGRFLVYGQGPEFFAFHGEPYSSPSFGGLKIIDTGRELTGESYRLPKTNIWRHEINMSNRQIAVFEDALSPDSNVLVRRFTAREDIVFEIESPYKPAIYREYDFNSFKNDCLMLRIKEAEVFFTGLSSPKERRLYIIPTGSCVIDIDGHLIIEEGEGEIWFISGLPEDAIKLAGKMKGKRDIFTDDRKFFGEYLKNLNGWTKTIPQTDPLKEEIKDLADSVAVMIKSQQSYDGGVAAGHRYPLAYVRDQAGVLRGLLAIGADGDAKAILEFWLNKWKTHKKFANADGMGEDDMRLIFPNDKTEVPAYIINSACQYYDKTKDRQFILKLAPMLLAAFETQLEELGGYMMGFSGDETYIAGGVFPLEFMYQGSAEATLLFLVSGKRLLKIFDENDLYLQKVFKYKETLKETEEHYRRNFVFNGKLSCNNPARERILPPPRFKHGFCEIHDKNDYFSRLTWIERREDGFYSCPDCKNKSPMQTGRDPARKYHLSSVSFLPAYLDGKIFTDAEIGDFTKEFFNYFNRTGLMPSSEGGTRSLGYDYGLLLYNAVTLKHPLTEKAFSRLISLADRTGAWAEYYDGELPFNCRCRPWESAINLEAIVLYYKNLKKLNKGL